MINKAEGETGPEALVTDDTPIPTGPEVQRVLPVTGFGDIMADWAVQHRVAGTGSSAWFWTMNRAQAARRRPVRED